MLLFFVFTSCSETIDNTGTCYDGVKNQGEQGIDCGGPCQAACASCADGIMNQGETAVDCGCLLYTSGASAERASADLGGRRTFQQTTMLQTESR